MSDHLLRTLPAPDVRGVSLVGNTAYWPATASSGSLMRADIVSGQPQLVADASTFPAQAAAFDEPDSLQHNGNYLYWRTSSGTKVWRMPIAGGAPTELSSVIGDLGGPTGFEGAPSALTVNGQSLFWIYGPVPIGTSDVEFDLYTAPAAGGSAKKIGAYQSSQQNLQQPFEPLAIEANAQNVFLGLVSGASASSTVRVDLDGSNATDLAGLGGWLALDGSNVLFVAGAFAQSVPEAGGALVALSMGIDPADTYAVNQGITVDQGTAYVTTLGTTTSSGLQCCSCGWIWGVPDNAKLSTPDVLWAGTGRPTAIRTNANYVVSADIDNHQLLVLSK